ncbi:MAG: hypothetical protein NT023_06910 [Armatimonadetes bacterium]|nr:hypothetical protein [Armatimonadota bacterium]
MPTIFDMFGYPLTNRGEEVEASRKAKLCPFSGAVCDGGGNRSQTKIKLAQEEPLTSYFNHGIKDVVPGICSIHAAGDLWVVCPRRLLAFKHDGEGLPIVNSSLQTHEHDLLINVGLPRSVDIGIWSEVYLKLSGVDADTNYHFDYVAAPLKRGTLSQEAAIYGADATELGEVILNAKRGVLEARSEMPF